MTRTFQRAMSGFAGTFVFLAFAALAQAQNCSLSSWTGTHFFLTSGTAPNSNATGVVPYTQFGKLVSDGKGNITGSATESAAGVIVPLTLNGTYTVNADCSGTQNLTITPQGSSPYSSTSAFRVVYGGQEKIIATEDSGVVMTGVAYRAFAESPAVCGNGTLNGSYGFLGSSPALGTMYPNSVAGGLTFDGMGGVAYNVTVNDSVDPITSLPGSGAYSVASDCSGTGTSIGRVNKAALAIVEGGLVLLMDTDAGSDFWGTVQPESRALLLPQLAFGGGWYSALYFTNATNAAVGFPVTFTADDGTPLTVPSVGGSSTTVNVPALGTAIVEAPNTGLLVQGYAAFALPPGVSGYGIFRQSATGKPDQEAVVPFSVAYGSSSELIWDETDFTTAVAIVNAGSVAAAISITLWDNGGKVVGTSTVTLLPHQKTEADMRLMSGLSGMVGLRGRATFAATSGNVAVLGLRFGGTAFTSIPTN